MANILGALGWDSGQLMVTSVNYVSGTVTIQAAAAHTGTYGMQLYNDGSAQTRYIYPAAIMNPSLSMWVRLYSHFNRSYFRCGFTFNTGISIEARWNGTTHTFDVYVNGGLVAAGSVTFGADAWIHMQLSAVCADSGSVGIKLNGQTSVAYTGDTKPGAETGVSYAFILSSGATQAATYVDDFVYGYDGFLGQLVCIDLAPNADTAVDDWTPSAGDNYQCVDDRSTSAATLQSDYVHAETDALADELALANFDGVTYVPVTVVAYVYAAEGEAAGSSLKVGVNSGGVVDVETHPIFASPAYYQHVVEENPDGSVPWDDAAIDALLLRYESVQP